MPPRTHFVCQHLENISRTALEKFQPVIQSYVRRRQGVYALYHGRKLYYVGLAINLRSRLKNHLKGRHGSAWDRFSVYLTVGDTHLRELEALILRVVKPVGNKQTGRLPRSLDMRRQFARDMRKYQREEIRAIIGKPAHDREQPAVTPAAGPQPVLAPYVKGPLKLRARFKGKLLHARLRRDGRIRFGGTLYDSPSHAGSAACQRKTCNGWTFWEYERARGDWVSLNELRR
jgi:Restriction Enzyme Adenine Methylase Associated